jgi:[ribosomal protein S5]-alanine N-acetyltransferase
MREALTALLTYGFDELGLTRVEADVDPRNAASLGLHESLGFICEGYLHERWIIDGTPSDAVFCGLRAAVWRAHRSGG